MFTSLIDEFVKEMIKRESLGLYDRKAWEMAELDTKYLPSKKLPREEYMYALCLIRAEQMGENMLDGVLNNKDKIIETIKKYYK